MTKTRNSTVYSMIYTEVEKFLVDYTDEERLDEDCKAATDFLITLFGAGSPDSAELPWVVLEWIEEVHPSEAVFWAVVVFQWSSFDLIPHAEFEAAFSDYTCPPGNLPVRGPVTIYRGQSAVDRKGLSWTLNKSVAEMFARGHRGIPVSNPVVLEMQVEWKDVAFYTNARDEEEVVLLAIPD